MNMYGIEYETDSKLTGPAIEISGIDFQSEDIELVMKNLSDNMKKQCIQGSMDVLFGFQFAISNIQTMPSDLFSGKSVGTLAGLGGTVGILSVIIMNFLIPIITKTSYTPAFVIIAAFVPLGVFAVFKLCKEIGPVEIKNQ